MICAKNYENIFKFVKVTHTIPQIFFRTRCRSLTINQLINLVNYCGGEKTLSPPRFQHCGGERPRCPRGSDAFKYFQMCLNTNTSASVPETTCTLMGSSNDHQSLTTQWPPQEHCTSCSSHCCHTVRSGDVLATRGAAGEQIANDD